MDQQLSIEQTASLWAVFPIHEDSPGSSQSSLMERVHLMVLEECWSVTQTCKFLEAVTFKPQGICMTIYRRSLKTSQLSGLKRFLLWVKSSPPQCVQWLESVVHIKFSPKENILQSFKLFLKVPRVNICKIWWQTVWVWGYVWWGGSAGELYETTWKEKCFCLAKQIRLYFLSSQSNFLQNIWNQTLQSVCHALEIQLAYV